ncbi:beta-hydroxylase [Pseudomonas brassicacearum]|uniref:Beta-hydroxylase n=1 Tax=Pseudomonas brassicacearum TaxID=930166 RepID=A0A423H3Z5_9PSED|nr:aspartyl/asparaginyl beta-hydroxylase domain-containing protein [Pseudomonas brassicacearum]RON07460.1 beta-hydroxylase [Pseudomonas brassicacearum]
MNTRVIRKKAVSAITILGIAAIIYCFPVATLWFLVVLCICGIYDFLRNGIFDIDIVKKYFIGGGRNTWLLAPLNTFFDLLCKPSRYVYKLRDLPEGHQHDINYVIETAMAHKEEIIEFLDARMAQKKRGMLFFQWYGRTIDTELNIPALQKKLPYIKTIGVSVFNENQSTSFHFGPLRMMYRVLYNIMPAAHHDGVYIQVRKQKHYWHDDPLFIFDDTLLHASFNKNDAKRYCLFLDILRPSWASFILNGIVASFAGAAFALRRFFYKNWKLIQ